MQGNYLGYYYFIANIQGDCKVSKLRIEHFFPMLYRYIMFTYEFAASSFNFRATNVHLKVVVEVISVLSMANYPRDATFFKTRFSIDGMIASMR